MANSSLALSFLPASASSADRILGIKSISQSWAFRLGIHSQRS